MAATMFIEQDRGTFIRAPHRYNGYNAGFSTPRSETPLVVDPRREPVARRGGEHTRDWW